MDDDEETDCRWAELVKRSDLSFPGGLGCRAGGIKLPFVHVPFVPRHG